MGLSGFHAGVVTGALFGYNVPLVQNGLEGPWIAKPHDAQPRRFAFFTVDPVDAGARDNAFLNAVLLDYSRGRNFSLDPANTLRDYLVRAGEDLYLGKAYVAVGPTRIPVSHLVLERHRPHDFVR